jgi:AraC-like DNA-binding protein
LRRASSFDSYVADPIGCYIAGIHAAAFWATETLNGISFWGQLDESDVEMVARAVRAVPGPSSHSHASLVDLRRLELLDLRALDKLCSELGSHFSALGPGGARRAVISPDGRAGLIVADLFKLLIGDASARSFADAVEALGWVDADDRTLLGELDRMRSPPAAHDSVLLDLRKILGQSPRARVEEMARHFDLSQRTLQRRLRELGTSFQQEVSEARIRIAKTMMRQTDRPLKWIAVESGYASLPHFSAAFRAGTGLSPGQWRARSG